MDNRVLFAVLCILFNQLGVPCFIQGNASKGIKRILFGFLTCGVIAIINAIKGIIMGIQILKMTDEEYAAKKGTFDSGIPA
jgi:hypothetical protein